MQGDLTFRVLGTLDARRGAVPIDLGGPLPRRVLAELILRAGRPASTDALIDVLWPDAPPKTARKTLQKYISQLRKQLGPIIETHPSGYSLELAASRVDVTQFDRLIDSAKGLPPEAAAQRLHEALDLWRGEPFADLADTDGGMAERARLAERKAYALEELASAELEAGRHDRAVARLEELVVRFPLRERLWNLLMLALYRTGRQVEALRTYQRLRDALGAAGVEPSEASRELEDRILMHDPELDPPLQEGGASNLPVRLTSFIGRNDELEALEELLGRRRAVTLVGPGGSGKTRLAIEVVDQTIGPRDGTWFVELAPLTSPDDIATAIAEPLGVTTQPGRPILDVLSGFLANKDLCLILDNCEHLVGDVARIAEGMLRSAPGLKILATSREALGIAGETTFHLGPLPLSTSDGQHPTALSDAVQLFVDRAGAADRNFQAESADLDAIAEICRKLDGMPLAIELAAARARSFPLDELTSLLDRRFVVLKSPLRDAPGRHGTLQAAVAWSYDLLSDQEQTLFRRLSVFRGGFDIEAAAVVCATPPLTADRVVALIPELVDKSLVDIDRSQQTGRARFKLLETLREFGGDVLDGLETTQLRDAHASFFCRVAEEAAPHLRGKDQAHWIRRLRGNYENLRRALRWGFSQHPDLGIRMAIALSTYWDAMGPRTEALQWLERAVDLTKRGNRHLYIAARLAAGDLFMSANLSHSSRYAEEALAEAERVGDDASRAAALRALGFVRALEGDHDGAAEAGSRALNFWRADGDAWEIAWSLERFGDARYRQPGRSLELYEESLSGYRAAGDARRAGMVLYKMADAGARAGLSVETTSGWVDESLEIFDQMGSTHDSAHALLELGKIYRRAQRPNEALEALEKGLDRMRMIGDERCTQRTLTALGRTFIDLGQTDAAAQRLLEALRIGEELDERLTLRTTLAAMSYLLADSGEPDTAAKLFSTVARLGDELGLEPGEESRKGGQQFKQRLQSELGPQAFAAAWDLGSSLTIRQAVALATGTATHRTKT